MRRTMFVLMAVAATVVMIGCTRPADKDVQANPKAQTMCPVMTGSKIDKKLFVDYNGKRVYFCCPSCPPMFNKDPEKYMKIMEKEGVELEKTPAVPK